MDTLQWLRGIAPGAHQAKVDHPMASVEEARVLLEQLPAGNPRRCLAESANWLSTIALTEGFAPVLRAQVVALVEDYTGPSADALVNEIFAAGGGATEGFAKVDDTKPVTEADPAKVQQLFDYVVALTDAQGSFVASLPGQSVEAEPESRGMLVRHAHALARRMALRRELRLPAEPQDWAQLDACFAHASALKSARSRHAVGGPGGIDTTVLREYLRAVLFDLGAPESLNARAVELLYRLAGWQAGAAQLTAERTSGARFAAFPGKGIPPRPVARVPASSKSARYLDLAQCISNMQALVAEPSGRGAEAADRALGIEFGAAERGALIAHAIAHWGPDPPHRLENRLQLTGAGKIVGGFGAALEVIEPVEQGAWLKDLSSLGPLAGTEMANDPVTRAQREQTQVRIHDASARGLGILAPRRKCAWVRVGSLIAVRVESAADWALATVCRVGASGEDLQLGLRILVAHPRVLWLRVPGHNSERMWARSKKPIDIAAGLVRALLPAPDPRGLVAGELLLDPGIAETAEAFEVPLLDRLQCIRVVKQLGVTADFARVIFVLADSRPLPRWARAPAAKATA